MTLLICRTCPRYDLRRTGGFGRDLSTAITASGTDVPIRKVQCLGGCPGDGVVTVDGPSGIALHRAPVLEQAFERGLEQILPVLLTSSEQDRRPKQRPAPLSQEKLQALSDPVTVHATASFLRH
jgi:hypothetical protein